MFVAHYCPYISRGVPQQRLLCLDNGGTTRLHRGRRKFCPSCAGRRELLLGGFGPFAIDQVANNVRDEWKLWGQELSYYARKAREKLSFDSRRPNAVKYSFSPRIDDLFSQLLLNAPIEAAKRAFLAFDEQAFQRDFQVLYNRELPYFEKAGLCGHCGQQAGFSDSDYFNFVVYVEFKCLCLQLPAYAWGKNTVLNGADVFHEASLLAPSTADALDSSDKQQVLRFRRDIGTQILNAAAQEAPPEVSALLMEGPPVLQDIRAGTKYLLDFFKSQGCEQDVALVQYGMSRDEYEAFIEWQAGEPAIVKYWLKGDVTRRSSDALKAEESMTPDFIFVTVAAYLARRQVESYRFQRVPLYLHDDIFSEQFSIRRIGKLPEAMEYSESGFQYDGLEKLL